MKTLLIFGFLTIAMSAQAVELTGKLSCKGERDGTTLSLESDGAYFFERGAVRLFDPIATYQEEGGKAIVGRAPSITNDENYKGRKYKNHARFTLSQLVNTEDFGRFVPADACVFQVLIPLDGAEKGTFEAPVIIGCDQSGGGMTLQCEMTDGHTR